MTIIISCGYIVDEMLISCYVTFSQSAVLILASLQTTVLILGIVPTAGTKLAQMISEILIKLESMI